MNRSIRLPLTCIFFLISFSLSAMSQGITVGTWNPGSSACLGTSIGLTQRLEAEFFTTARIAPRPLSEVSAGALLTASLLAPREFASGEASLFANLYLSAGYLYGSERKGILVRFTPLSTGGPYYGIRERALSFGGLYEPGKGDFSLFVQMYLIDFYL